MSDGPHKSLPMRPAWRRVAERCDKPAFTGLEISEALVPALEQDCRVDVPPAFLAAVRRVAAEPPLFASDVSARLEPLRSEAGSGIGRALLDNVSLLSTKEGDAFTLIQDALKGALLDRANRCARQMEEHYFRETSTPRAINVRDRLEDAIGCTDLSAIAERVLSVPRRSAPQAPARRPGLDDGVNLR